MPRRRRTRLFRKFEGRPTCHRDLPNPEAGSRSPLSDAAGQDKAAAVLRRESTAETPKAPEDLRRSERFQSCCAACAAAQPWPPLPRLRESRFEPERSASGTLRPMMPSAKAGYWLAIFEALLAETRRPACPTPGKATTPESSVKNIPPSHERRPPSESTPASRRISWARKMLRRSSDKNTPCTQANTRLDIGERPPSASASARLHHS